MTIEALETKVTNIGKDLATLDEDVTRIEDRVAGLLLHSDECDKSLSSHDDRLSKLETTCDVDERLLKLEAHAREMEQVCSDQQRELKELQARLRKLEALAERSDQPAAPITTTRIVSPVSPEWFDQVEQSAAQGVDGWRMEPEAAVEPETDSPEVEPEITSEPIKAKTRAPRKPNGSGAKLSESVLVWAAGRGPFSRAEALAALPGWTEQQMSVAMRGLKEAGKLTMTGDRSTARYVLP